MIPPVLVREQALYGTGFLPDTEQQIYRVPEDDLYLAGTSEVPLASLHAGQILDEDELPLRYAGFSTCFRREAGAAGKDTQGIFRVHQFDKVEMFTFVRARGVAGRARAAARDRGGDPAGARDPLPGGEHRGGRPRRLGREEVRPRGVAARARAATASSPRARTRPTSRRAASTCATARRTARARARAHAQRHGRRGRAARSSRSSRTTSRTTARRDPGGAARVRRAARAERGPRAPRLRSGRADGSPRRGGREVECTGLESRKGPFGPSWVRIPPPPFAWLERRLGRPMPSVRLAIVA